MQNQNLNHFETLVLIKFVIWPVSYLVKLEIVKKALFRFGTMYFRRNSQKQYYLKPNQQETFPKFSLGIWNPMCYNYQSHVSYGSQFHALDVQTIL